MCGALMNTALNASFNACPVLRLDIREYDLVKDAGSIEPIIERIAYFIEQTRMLKN